MLVDVHNHVVPEAVLRLAKRDTRVGFTVDGGMWRGRNHVPFPMKVTFTDPHAKLSDLQERGLWGAVISPAPVLFAYDRPIEVAVAMCEATNEGSAEFCSSAPDRYHWLANVPMQDPDRAATMYVEAVAAGAVGASVGTSIAGSRLDNPKFDVFWAQVDAIGKPVLVHPAFNAPHPALGEWYLQNAIGNPLETTITVERLVCSGMLERYPRVRLVLVHGGGFVPYQLGRLVHARTVREELTSTPAHAWEFLGQLYFDTITHDAQALRYLAERVGVDHVVLGTDLPFDMALTQPADDVAKALGAAQLQAVGVTNPRKLFGI